MENFILYEEIGKGHNSIVYKGRRKGTIKFLSILCIEKEERAAVTNWVRLVHEVNHDNIVRFYEWYETTNHLWMVTELCTGGTLELVLEQDGNLPEDTIRTFGRDILAGLFYLHSHSIVFSDLCPRKILLDGPGVLKLTNFCLGRLQDENLHDVYLQASGQLDTEPVPVELKGKLEYQAPEVLQGGNISTASDIWAFGVLIYHMFTGSLPFKCTSSTDLLNDVSNLSYVDPQLKRDASTHGRQANSKASEELLKLIAAMLQKDPAKRPSAQELIHHPFWQGLNGESLGKQDASLNNTVITVNSEKDSGDSLNNTVTSHIDLVNNTHNSSGDGDHLYVNKVPESVIDSTFTLSSRPHTAKPIDDPVPEKVQKLNDSVLKPDTPSPMAQSALGETYTIGAQKDAVVSNSCDDKAELIAESVNDLIYHCSDIEVDVIQDNQQIRKLDPPRWDAKLLPFRALVTVDGVTPDDLYSHLKQIQQALNQHANASQHRVKANLSSYLAHLATLSTAVANYIMNSPLLFTLVSMVKNTIQQSPDVACKAARVIGLAASCSTELEQCTRITEVFSTMAEILRENFRSVRSKLFLVPAIGQLLYFVAEQEQGLPTAEMNDEKRPQTNHQKSQWSVPTATYNLITRCLREGEDTIVQHFACKIIQSVSNTSAHHGKKFISGTASGPSGTSHSSDIVGPMLWSVSERSTTEALKHCALSSLLCLNRLSGCGMVLQAVLDRVGLPSFFSVLGRTSYKCQQAVLAAFVETLHSTPKGQATRIANGKEVLPNLMKFLENPSSIVRAKVILGILLLMKRKPSLLLQACQNRLIMYIERDFRRISTPTVGTQSRSTINFDYIHACLNFLIRYMASQAPQISTLCLSILDEAIGRKHPSTQQVKQLRATLPTCHVLYHMVTSQVFRSQIITSELVDELGKLLTHVTQFIKKTSGIISAVGDDIIQKFIDSVLSSIECLSQHPLLLANFQESTMRSLVPQLIHLLTAYNSSDGQMVCMTLITEIFGNLLRFNAMNVESSLRSVSTPSRSIGSRSTSSRLSSRGASRRHELPDICGIQDIIMAKLIPELKTIIQCRDPLPAYAVKLLGTLLEHWPSLCETVHLNGIVSLLLVMFDEFKSAAYSSCIQEIASILTVLARYATDEVMSEMHHRGLIDNLLQYVTETSYQYSEAQSNQDTESMASSGEILLYLLNLLKGLLERVTVAVRQALQPLEASQSSMKSHKLQTDDAEQLLVMHKPLTELQGICIHLLCEEQELCDPALACISLLVQLYGGDHPDTFSIENMNSFAQALYKSPSKMQRILLKLIKRIVSLNDYHAEQLNCAEGRALVEAVQILSMNSEKIADANIAQLTTDVLEFVTVK